MKNYRAGEMKKCMFLSFRLERGTSGMEKSRPVMLKLNVPSSRHSVLVTESRFPIIQKPWIPAFAGMTYYTYFTKLCDTASKNIFTFQEKIIAIEKQLSVTSSRASSLISLSRRLRKKLLLWSLLLTDLSKSQRVIMKISTRSV